MMINNNIDHTISSTSSLNNCRQIAGFSGKNDDVNVLARRKRNELRRLKVLALNNSNGSDGNCVVSKRGRIMENLINNSDNNQKGDDINDHSIIPYRSSVIGRRREMEDAVSVELGFVVTTDNEENSNKKKFDFYGVYDGHGGSRVANACRERLHKLLAQEMIMMDIGEMNKDWEGLMVESFAKMDEEVNESDPLGSTGSTAVVAVVGDEEIVVANCGDSRAVLSRGGATLPLSNDHKPDRPDELERIEHSGGKVIEWNGIRVLGVLATSRSIGDRQLKPYVIAKPEVTVTKRHENDEFMILASDGLWDVMSNELACHIVSKCIEGRVFRKKFQHTTKDNYKYKMTNAATVLTELAMARGSKDNISVIVVNLKERQISSG
uniref:protein phosphatase 2C 51-like n=1 Tax=Erigeron canadensis TaxID=72917 RepID=UPI001CB8E2E8|nr:protein phosphatase 2C 51-like [Erigeron canadensis]